MHPVAARRPYRSDEHRDLGPLIERACLEVLASRPVSELVTFLATGTRDWQAEWLARRAKDAVHTSESDD